MKKENSEKSDLSWFIIIFVTTFLLSILFSYISTTAINNLEIVPAIVILLVVIFVGILFDIIGVSVTVAREEGFHAKASKKITGAKTAIKLIRNSSKVANICADVIGDICGVLSGAISAIVTIKITEKMGLTFDLQFIISAVVASLTVGGKAIGKEIAKKYNNEIINFISKIEYLWKRK